VDKNKRIIMRFLEEIRIANFAYIAGMNNWCSLEDCLRGRGYEEDLMQEIHLRLMNTTVDYFLLRQGIDGPVNNDPQGFHAWMIEVAKNLKKTFVNRVRSMDFKTQDLSRADVEGVPDDTFEQMQERIERLKAAFTLVLAADVGIYKVLTWLAQFVVILDSRVTKKESNDLIVQTFEDKSLYEMYDMILSASVRIPWIVVTKEQNDAILTALQEPWEGDISYGEAKYKMFFMKHNGEVSGKKSISDWVNRMNSMIKRKLDDSDGLKKPGKKQPGTPEDSTRRGTDGSSDS